MSKSKEDVKCWRTPGLYYGMGNKATDLLYKHYDHGLKLNLKLAQKKAYASNVTIGSLEYSGQEKLSAGICQNSPTVKVGLDLKSRFARINTAVECGKNSSILYSLIVGNNLFSQQTDISIDATTGILTKCDFGWNSSVKNTIFTFTVCDMGDALKTSLYHSFSHWKKTAVGFEVVLRPNTEKTITIGAKFKLDRSKLVKVRGDNRGRIGLVVQHKLTPTSQITLFGEADVKAIRTTAKMGLGLAKFRMCFLAKQANHFLCC